LCIIVISLVFSVFLQGDRRENFANPPASDITAVNNILSNSSIDTFTKIQQIYPIAQNNSVFFNIYNNISDSYISAITDYIKNGPIVDSNGKQVDANSISQANIEQINGILYNKKNANMTSFEKINAIKQYICNDKNSCDSALNRIFTTYMQTWIDIITNYVNKIQSSNNMNVAKAFAQFQ
jgi:hypothetical protein